ncbi:MAG TPA: methylenetetrahydrofolate--tRNA-(uracil(54)-C(5))-methyltransferase (FADH(2)-oxidizing) TrmFO [Bryobacteraceae bacterium]|jgi:methylenetetrahydrofolate--tRNA-(uracil-5-)-methyltransferase|nr:methylenetetrahydrofolate--tRNA-(uracil(54)-C(5))-methyltransferase (FADH(2)-oxidizing) TrmFO [Bryobacteraceae bacterium]
MDAIHVIGAGLAGCEAAFQAAEAGAQVVLHEMRPEKRTAAHKTDCFGELVCSNSLKSEQVHSAPWLLKQELRRLGSLLMKAAQAARVPGGHALTVDREIFSREITHAMESHRRIEVRRGEVTGIPREGVVIVATGPLTSDALAQDIGRVTGVERLFFYDSISPIVAADSIDLSIAFRASRYGKSLDGTDDYINCPFNKEEYDAFVSALMEAQFYEPHIEEDKISYFEGCLPIEEIARRGRDTLRFGPMKPAGLPDPRTGKWPYAVVQLRQENQRADSYNLVGFQNHMKYGDQARVFRMIPGLAKAEFLRFGQMHRNTYINSPALLRPTLQLKTDGRVFFTGQICGVEGYAESIATGLIAGRNAALWMRGERPEVFPRETALGSLCHYITHADAGNFQPANITFDLLPALDEAAKRRLRHDKKARHAEVCRRAAEAFERHASTRMYCEVSG